MKKVIGKKKTTKQMFDKFCKKIGYLFILFFYNNLNLACWASQATWNLWGPTLHLSSGGSHTPIIGTVIKVAQLVVRVLPTSIRVPLGRGLKLSWRRKKRAVGTCRNSTYEWDPWKGVLRFGKRGKLSSRYIGPYRIVERIGEVAYRLELPSDLDCIHDVFHVSMLRQYIPDPSHVLIEQPVEIQENLTYEKEPVQILDRREQVLRNKTIPLVKVLWRSHTIEEATWEPEAQMRHQYPHLFSG